MSGRVSILVSILGLALSSPVMGSDAGYLYGRVTTVGGDAYQGELRWGTEEAFWDDLFNGDKAENRNLEYLDHQSYEHVRSRHWGQWVEMLGIGDSDLTHSFAVRFGDLDRIDVLGGERALAVFRNGRQLELHGGSNDIGATITVVDPQHGVRDVPWSRIRKIQFLDTPARLANRLGAPLYGTVKAGRHAFTGRIQWDEDEDLSIDKLDGDTRDGREHLAFADVVRIRKEGRGSRVTLQSGDQLFMTGTNDVNRENRGIVVHVPQLGAVKVGWDDFDEVTFRPAPTSGPGYDDYEKGRDLMGSVATREGRDDGRIIFDLDETWDFEMLQGEDRDTEYIIPFREIARLSPRGNRRSEIVLRSGKVIELEDSHDVSRENDGLLVFEGDRDPMYIDWRDVAEIEFR